MALLTYDDVDDAVRASRRMIEHILEGPLPRCEQRDAVAITVLDPEKLTMPTEAAVLWGGYVGANPQTWARPLDEFAFDKAKLSQKKEMDTLDVIARGLLEVGDIKYPGGIYRQRRIGGKLITIVIGVSGHQYMFDIAIAEILSALCFAQLEAAEPSVVINPQQSAYVIADDIPRKSSGHRAADCRE